MDINGVSVIDVTQVPTLSDDTYKIESSTVTDLVNISDKQIEIASKGSILLDYLNLIVKRIMDIIGAIVGIILLIPITIGIAIANICVKDFGPLFYVHERIGKNGKKFKMFKFRSMVVNADEKLEEVLENDRNAKAEWEANQKIQNDPRVTKVGAFIRKTSLDEFPQFINVLMGNMSLVGPRAVVDGEIEKFGILKEKVLSVKPGITGYWAANGRSNKDYKERVIMEATYVDNFSVINDIKLLTKTILSVVKKEGAV